MPPSMITESGPPPRTAAKNVLCAVRAWVDGKRITFFRFKFTTFGDLMRLFGVRK